MSDTDKDFAAGESEAFKQRELELQAEVESIIKTIDDLGLNEKSHEDLQYFAAKWFLELKNSEHNFEQSLSLNKKNVGDYLALGRGKATGLIERARMHDGGKGGKNKAANDEKSLAYSAIEKKWNDEKLLKGGLPRKYKAIFIDNELKHYPLLGLDFRHLENKLKY